MRVSLQLGLAAIASAMAVAPAAPAWAQAMSPMRGEVKSFSDQFAVRVFPMNPYQHRIKVEVRVYDETFAPVRAAVHPAETMLAPNGNRSVLVMVPFDGKTQRKVRVCTEAVPLQNKTQRVRTQICGRFIATRLQ
ncbi:MAG: hypothetical protein AB7E80_03360 [Hyphomicrobiaceae bacterium]